MDALNICYEHRSNAQILENYPFYDLSSFAPAKTLDDPNFGEPTGGQIDGAIFFPNGGYISDPQFATRNIQLAAERAGAAFLFNSRVKEIPTKNGSVEGVLLSDGTRINAMGSATEVEYLILLCKDIQLLSPQIYEDLQIETTQIKKMLASFIKKLRSEN